MVRVVFDTVIFVRCLLNPFSRWGRLVFAHAVDYRQIVSQPVLVEILEVLDRPELTRKSRFVAGMDKRAVLAVLGAAEVVDVPSIPAVSRDVKDDKILATARAAGAAFVVTEDDDLLVLGEYDGVRIVDAETFLSLLEQNDPEGDTS